MDQPQSLTTDQQQALAHVRDALGNAPPVIIDPGNLRELWLNEAFKVLREVAAAFPEGGAS